MYSVEVHTDFSTPGRRDRITRFLVFDTYSGAINCKDCLEGVQQSSSKAEDYFEAAKMSRVPVGEVVNARSIQTDWVLWYLEKTYN